MEKSLSIKYSKDKKLKSYKACLEVKKIGNSGHVILPQELIGKFIEVVWEETKWTK